MSNKSKLIGAVAGATLALGGQTVLAGGHKEMTVAYFLCLLYTSPSPRD